ncbi:MAG: hypothetical protein KA175_16455 [Flavobacteriales bacterium]|nr:hypothetical protein [Flavobacteriales bacterium]MBP6699216.1 hypothetical protein [Flavobacteriales bacterium]
MSNDGNIVGAISWWRIALSVICAAICIDEIRRGSPWPESVRYAGLAVLFGAGAMEKRTGSRTWHWLMVAGGCLFGAAILYDLASGFYDGSTGAPHR